MNCTCRTYHNAFATQFALRIINVCHIALDCDSLVRTSLRAESASDAGSLAGLARNRTFVLVYTRHIDTHTARTFVSKFNDRFRTSLYAGAASDTLALVNHRESCLFIH